MDRATYVKTREAGRIESVAVGVNTEGQREVLGLKVGASEAEPFWTDFDADSQARLDARRRRSRPVADALHQWMRQQRQKGPDGSATARAIGYSLNPWAALTRFLDDGDLPIDNN